MFRGVIFALFACLIWGSIFIVPQFMQTFTPFEIALGRYLFYGLASFFLFLKGFLQGKMRYDYAAWIKALYFALSSLIYYSCLVFGIRLSSPAICALILGISPVTIALYGNLREKEISFRSLFLPSLLILIGLLIINIPHVSSCSNYFWGIFFSLLALINWSWFAVANARFLKDNPKISSSNWATLLGVANLVIVGGLLIFLKVIFPNHLNLTSYLTLTPEMIHFLAGSAFLGVACSWVGSMLWNKACLYLPISLAGQLMLFETVFGVLLFYILEQRLPPLLEVVGIVVLMGAIVFSLRTFSKEKSLEA